MDGHGLIAARNSAKAIIAAKQTILDSPNLTIRRRLPIRENLYVRGFDVNFTDEQLREEFSEYGHIKSAVIKRTETRGVSKKFGFVCFNELDASKRAISGLH